MSRPSVSFSKLNWLLGSFIMISRMGLVAVLILVDVGSKDSTLALLVSRGLIGSLAQE